jgi:hypothetical protein
MITGDDRAQLSATLSNSTVIADAPTDGLAVFRPQDDSEVTKVYRIDGAILLSDRWQAGGGLPFLSRSVAAPGERASADRFGDAEVDTAYEFLPEWNYSAWKPRGHVFLAGAIPTGRSIYESELPGFVDATGKGFYRLQAGIVLTKRWQLWDASLITELHRSFPRTFAPTSNDADGTRVDPGAGGSFSAGVGYSPKGGDLRLGLRVQPIWNSGRSILSGGTRRDSSAMRTVDTAIDANYLVAEERAGTWTLFASYVDQTLLGPARNATLSRTVALGLQHRWNR